MSKQIVAPKGTDINENMTLSEFEAYYRGLDDIEKASNAFMQDAWAFPIALYNVDSAQEFIDNEIKRIKQTQRYKDWFKKQLKAKEKRLRGRGQTKLADEVLKKLKKL